MDLLSTQIVLDEIGQILKDEGKSPDDIRLFFEEEGERVATEIEDEMGSEY
ncbi:hypothetical protein SAMN03080615_00858 [Amphritea atlantica]|uniref:Uncharacterized protein n=1 Tax=Amphritea atlantica TaxID=355243 RepID=A0A1H9EGF2_9GAMM|nr:hypothetical protein [Amphritea atlantica]SEQ24108.1 hypothetical protein SAMN03080615_00858 [Amphritea atlantica]